MSPRASCSSASTRSRSRPPARSGTPRGRSCLSDRRGASDSGAVMLVPVAPELWTAEHLLALPGGVRLPGRMTVARLPGSRLLVYSPIPLTDALGATIDVIGKVTWLVAPSVQHHRFVGHWLARYP